MKIDQAKYLKKLLADEKGNTIDLEKKSKIKSTVKWAHGFPDFYKVGMLNTGFQMAYFILNAHNDIFCERFFLPDFGNKILTLETQSDLLNYDIISFSLPFEMLYTNVLKILDLSKIRIFTKNRRKPLLIGGGNGPICNPEPLAEFFDVLVIGEIESTLNNIANTIKKLKDKKKEKLLLELAKLPGVYVPSFYDIIYTHDGKIKDMISLHEDVPQIIKRQWPDNIEFYTDFIVSKNTLWPNFYFIEISRGCIYNCKFCMLGAIYKKARFRSLKKILEIADKASKITNKIRLVSPTEYTHPNIKEILTTLKNKGFQIIVGSQRADWINKEFVDYIDNKTFTIAPEAGSNELRRFIGKDMSNREIFRSIKIVNKNKLDEVQLYLIVGFPNEIEKDIDKMIKLITQVRNLLDRERYERIKLKLAINCFIIKPHTIFQHKKQYTFNEYEMAIKKIKTSIKNLNNVELDLMDEKSILVQGIITRGDRKICKIIYDAYKLGDNPEAWEFACKKNNAYKDLLFSRKNLNDKLPWFFIDLNTIKNSMSEIK